MHVPQEAAGDRGITGAACGVAPPVDGVYGTLTPPTLGQVAFYYDLPRSVPARTAR